jgi:hypothetical protein
VARIDAGPERPLPILEQVNPGKHRVVVRCAEHVDDEREILATEGELTPMHAELRPAPGALFVRAPDGTAIYVDGRFEGRAPLTSPITLAAGEHDVAVLDSGLLPWGRRVTVGRATNVTIEGEPRRSTYRLVSYGLASAAVLSGATAAFFAGTSVVHDLRAQRFLQRREQGTYLDEADLASYANDAATHDESRGRALTFAIVTSVLTLGAAGLYFLDKPTVADVVYGRDDGPAEGKPRTALVPSFGADSAALDLRMRF